MNAFFDHAEKNCFALFPCAQGTKRPILKWKAGSTRDRAQWTAWQSDHNNLAIDCAKSEILMIDVDSSKVTREEAWGAYHKLCQEWGLSDPAPPMTQSARGGWHIPFRRPANFAATDLRGGGTLVKITDFRELTEGEEDGEVVGFKNRGYCVAPGSTLSTATGSLPYVLMTDPPAPHEAPASLLEAIKLNTIEATYSGQAGTSDKADVAKLVAELDMYGEFSTEPDWFKYMGAIKLALGDTENGVEVALQMTADDATDEAFWSRWNRLASVDDGGPRCRINSMIHRYKELTGKQFNIRTSLSAMFNGVAKLAAATVEPGKPTSGTPLFTGLSSPLRDVTLSAVADPLPNHPNLTAPQAFALEDFVAYLPGGTFCYLPTREMWPASGANAKLGDVTVNGVSKIRAATWLSQNRAADAMAWCPGEPMLIKDRLLVEGGWIAKPGDTTLNNYRPPTIAAREGDASLWLNHIKTIYPDDWEHIINWFGHRVQRPGEKINHALVLGGEPGVGKDTLLEPVKAAVGAWNFCDVSPTNVMGRFNGHLKSVVLRISEVHDLGDIDRFAFHDKCKTLCAAPPDTHRIDEKNMREYQAVNVCGVIMTTNHKAGGLYLPPDDRRHYVAWSPTPTGAFSSEYYDSLYRWFRTGGNEIVAHYLAALDISAFNAKAPPPKTAAFWEIAQSARAPESADVDDALDALGRPDAVTLAMLEHSPGATPEFRAWLGDRRNSVKIGHRMADAGYEAIRNPEANDGRWRIAGKRRVVYGRRTLSKADQLSLADAMVKGPEFPSPSPSVPMPPVPIAVQLPSAPC
ncbi:hypothetical protein ACVWXQ_004294 [Bradyrhizobium sp. S3.14.4]